MKFKIKLTLLKFDCCYVEIVSSFNNYEQIDSE